MTRKLNNELCRRVSVKEVSRKHTGSLLQFFHLPSASHLKCNILTLGFKVFIFPTPHITRDSKPRQRNATWDYLCATGNYNHVAMQQSASSQGVPASLSDSYFPLAASRKIETVYEKWKEGGKCHLSSVPPPVSVPAPVPRINVPNRVLSCRLNKICDCV